MGLINSIFGTYSDRQIKKIMPQVKRINALADTYKAMTDAEMMQMTDKLKGRLASLETLEIGRAHV